MVTVRLDEDLAGLATASSRAQAAFRKTALAVALYVLVAQLALRSK